MRLPVNEVFETLQGEAHFTGAPAVFLRLHGCDVGCPWCDTKHTWKMDPKNEIGFHAMVAKPGDAPTYAWVTVEQLAVHCALLASHVVVTGGEPCVYDLHELTEALLDAGKSVQIETSGTQMVLAHPNTWVTVSPKLDMPGGFSVRPDALERANEIKMPVGKLADVEKLQALVDDLPTRPMVWLQPLSTSEKATELCIKEATRRGWRVSIQTHKFIGVR